jgi:hypothetical protein
MKTIACALFTLLLGCSALPGGDLSGEWSGAGWGKVVISGARGTYTDTYQTGPGTFELRRTGRHTYEGTWGESKKRFGTLSFVTSEDERTIAGIYQADASCAIDPGSTSTFQWSRK